MDFQKAEKVFEEEVSRLRKNQELLENFYKEIENIKSMVQKEESKTQEIIDALEDFKTEVAEISIGLIEEYQKQVEESLASLEKRLVKVEKEKKNSQKTR